MSARYVIFMNYDRNDPVGEIQFYDDVPPEAIVHCAVVPAVRIGGTDKATGMPDPAMGTVQMFGLILRQSVDKKPQEILGERAMPDVLAFDGGLLRKAIKKFFGR